MDLILFLLCLVWITYRIGKEDGKWGGFIALVIFFLIAFIVAAFD